VAEGQVPPQGLDALAEAGQGLGEGATVAGAQRFHVQARDLRTEGVRTCRQCLVTDQPDLVTDHTDHFGNHTQYLEIRTPHTELVVAKRSVVTVDWPVADLSALDAFTVAEAGRRTRTAPDAPLVHTAYRLPSRLVDIGPEVISYAAPLLSPDRPFGESLAGVYEAIHADFRYQKGATSVRTTLPELLDLRAGVCQDFAHLALGCLRWAGLTARYVSGYLQTTPPPGKPRLAGSDATHAWVSVLTPDGSWVDLDPTNNHVADSRYIVSAWGRDFADVSPLKGVVFTESPSSRLTVGVDVTAL
jgi:transglutaminase-like putative cysteine protease